MVPATPGAGPALAYQPGTLPHPAALAGGPIAWRERRRILVVRPDNLGDVLLLGPALRALRDALPEAELWCLGPWVETILESEPGIARRFAPPGRLGPRLAQGRRLRQAGFDLALIFPNSFETALAASP